MTRGMLAVLMLVVVVGSVMAVGASRGHGLKAQVSEQYRASAYNTHLPIRINNNTNFTETAAREGWPGNGSAGNPIKIEGIDVNGTGYGYGIYIGNTTLHFTIENCTVHNVSGGAQWPYFPSAAVEIYNATNGTVKNNRIYGSKYGVIVYSNTAIPGTVISGNTITEVEEGILIQSRYMHTYVKITNNEITNITSSDTYLRMGIAIKDSSNNTIEENTIKYADGIGIYDIGGEYNTIINNTVTNGNDEGMELRSSWDIVDGNNISNNLGTGLGIYADDMTITGNMIYENGGDGIYIEANDVYVSYNTVKSNYGSGISLSGVYESIITNNTATNNSFGISIGSWSQYNNITYNNLSGNQQVGIEIDGGTTGKAQYNLIKSNVIMNNPWRGIYFYRHGEHNTITENTIWNDSYGIYIVDSGNNTFSYNSIANNTNYGVYIKSGTQNLIYNNTFARNNGATDTYSPQHVQACDDGTSNWWNTSGNPHGYGNYWADWTSPDDEAPYGIVDNPYNITGTAGARDYYPLTNAPSVPEMPNPLILVILIALIGAIIVRRNR